LLVEIDGADPHDDYMGSDLLQLVETLRDANAGNISGLN